MKSSVKLCVQFLSYSALSAVFCASAFAITPEVFKAVLANSEVEEMTAIHKVEIVATYRCPYCFDFLVSGEAQSVDGLPSHPAHIKLRTQGNLTAKTIDVTVVERTK